MTSNSYIIITAALNLIGLASFYLMSMNHRKEQEMHFSSFINRIMNVQTKDEFEEIYKGMTKNDLRAFTFEQREELSSLKEILSANLI